MLTLSNIEFSRRKSLHYLVILQYAGHDATEAYNEVHSPELIANLLATKRLGRFDHSTIDADWKNRLSILQEQRGQERAALPPLRSILSADDFELAAQASLSKKAWAFYSSAATDLVSASANRSFYSRIWFRPRLLRNVSDVDTRCAIQGVDCSLPVMVAPVALARLANEVGEMGIASAAGKKGIINCVCCIIYGVYSF